MSAFFRHQTTLYISVFLVGFVVLALETIAFRMLSPYFGSTIFSFSSVVTVVLTGLSVGYLLGGRYADREPHHHHFYFLVCAGGLISLFFYVSVPFILGLTLLVTNSVAWGPMVGSLASFFVPALVLGMVSPYAIKLAIMERGVLQAGASAGSLFAFSTAGSILGSVAAGFLLIPHFHLLHIVVGTSMMLVVWGGWGWWQLSSRTHMSALAFLMISGFGLFYAYLLGGFPFGLMFAGEIVHREAGVYQDVTVVDLSFENIPTRALILDRAFHSGIHAQTGELVFPYARWQHLYRLYGDGEPNHVLYLGGGSASFAHALIKETESTHATVVDIEPVLPRIANEYFGVPLDSPRLSYITNDARLFLRSTKQDYDFIFSDIFASVFSIPTHVMTVEFFRTVRDRLTDDGVFLVNVIGQIDVRPPSVLFSTVAGLAEVFPNVELYAVKGPQSTQLQNFIIVSSLGSSSAERIQLSEDLPSNITREAFLPHLVDLTEVDISKFPPYRDMLSSVEADLGRALVRFERSDLTNIH